MTNQWKPRHSRAECPKCGGRATRAGHSVDGNAQRYRCKKCQWHGVNAVHKNVDEAAGVDKAISKAIHRRIRQAKGVKRYVITSAQNATPVDEAFLATLIGYCKHNSAELIVIPYRYRNPTSTWSQAAQDSDWWAKEIVPYILDRRVDLNPNLVLLADIKTQPTATNPVTGFETETGLKSAIIGHPRVAMTSVATPHNHLPKILVTTGAVTKKNYIDSKAGKKGAHHHTFGACLVEVAGKRFHIRQLNAVRDGSFIDVDKEYRGSKVRKAPRAEALVMGDTHEEFLDVGVAAATFGKGGMLDVLKPKRLVWHDTHDFYARNHHHRNDHFLAQAKFAAGGTLDSVEMALNKTYAFIDSVTKPRPWLRNYFVASNHTDAFTRWMREAEIKDDPRNAIFYSETNTIMLRSAGKGKNGEAVYDEPWPMWAALRLKTYGQATFLGRKDPLTAKGVELSFHGDAGPGGAKGSRKGFSKIGVKSIIGHSHAPGITDGCYQVGMSSIYDREYVRGPSAALHAHCALYANGKRSIFIIIGDHWRA